MNYDKEIIKSLLGIIEDYNRDGIAKERTLGVFSTPTRDESVIVNICTRGESNKGTPFYRGSMYTDVIAEYWVGTEMVWAEILYSTSPNMG